MISAIGAVNLLLGYIDFTVTGAQTERFLTLVMKSNTDIWSIRRIDGATLSAKARRFDLDKVRELCAEAYCDFSLLHERGLPDQILRRRSRWGLAAGAVLFTVLIITMSCFVWSIDVTGADNPRQAQYILDILADNGLYVGALSGGQNWQKLKLRVLESTDEISYLTVNLNGSKVIVEVNQEIAKPEILDDYTPCNVVAAKTGQIVYIKSDNGTVQVKAGDAVVAGQLLISGVYDSRVIGYRVVHAYGTVKARTLRRISVFCPFEPVENAETGKTHTQTVVTLFGKDISFGGDGGYEYFFSSTDEKELTLGESFVLPVSVRTTVYREYEKVKTFRDYDRTLGYAMILLQERERIEITDAEVESRELRVTETADGVYCEYVYTLIEDIAQTQELYMGENE